MVMCGWSTDVCAADAGPEVTGVAPKKPLPVAWLVMRPASRSAWVTEIGRASCREGVGARGAGVAGQDTVGGLAGAMVSGPDGGEWGVLGSRAVGGMGS